MSLPASTVCSALIRESARVQEPLIKLDRALNKLLHTSTRLSTSPNLRIGQADFAMVPS